MSQKEYSKVILYLGKTCRIGRTEMKKGNKKTQNDKYPPKLYIIYGTPYILLNCKDEHLHFCSSDYDDSLSSQK
jgi:hypothetical protein